jgi:hypothetical protein
MLCLLFSQSQHSAHASIRLPGNKAAGFLGDRISVHSDVLSCMSRLTARSAFKVGGSNLETGAPYSPANTSGDPAATEDPQATGSPIRPS